MEEVVVGMLASAFVKMAGEKLGSAIAEQGNLLWNFRRDLEVMKTTLETMGAVLEDAEKRSIKEKEVLLWLKRLKNAASDISDVLDEFQDTDTQATSKDMRTWRDADTENDIRIVWKIKTIGKGEPDGLRCR